MNPNLVAIKLPAARTMMALQAGTAPWRYFLVPHQNTTRLNNSVDPTPNPPAVIGHHQSHKTTASSTFFRVEPVNHLARESSGKLRNN